MLPWEYQVLLSRRWNWIRHRKAKEWWFSGISDADQGVYLAIAVARVAQIDSLHISLYRKEWPEPKVISWKGFLQGKQKSGELNLLIEKKRMRFLYCGDERQGLHCRLACDDLQAELELHPTTPPFTKYDNMFSDEYSLMHFFHLRARGRVEWNGGAIELSRGMAYVDHCFGRVPSKTRWHWIAVQNENCALASLMNYGAFAQCYTQTWFNRNPEDIRGGTADGIGGRWIRLDQDVSFECNPARRWEDPWKITSPDMEIDVQILGHTCARERIPPFIPFLIDLDHHECHVRASGKIRVDGVWVRTGIMDGVLEEHHGRW